MSVYNDDFLGALADSNPAGASRLLHEFRETHQEYDGSPDALVHVMARLKLVGDDRVWLVHHTTEPTSPDNVRSVSQAWVAALKSRDDVLDLRVWRTANPADPEFAWMVVPIISIESVLVKAVTPERPNQDDERRSAGFHPPVNNKQQ